MRRKRRLRWLEDAPEVPESVESIQIIAAFVATARLVATATEKEKKNNLFIYQKKMCSWDTGYNVLQHRKWTALSTTGVVEYTDCTSVKR